MIKTFLLKWIKEMIIVPRIININKITIFLLYGPIKYLSKWILTHKKKEREIEGDMAFSGSLICDL